MKNNFSKSWKSSKLPRKQRKFRYNAPFHIKRKMMSVNLSKELRKKYGKRNFPAIKGDEIRIMRGEFKNRISKITDVDLKNMKIIIDGIYRTKKDGTKIQVEFEPSNLQIKNLELNDKKRKLALERKSSPEKKIEVKTKPLPKSKKQKEENRSQDAHK